MKYLVYHATASTRSPYVIETLHDGETYEVFEQQLFQADGSDLKAIIPRPHIVVRRDGQQVNLLTGDFVGEFEDQREARKTVSRLEQVQEVMES
jgi:hypothetical protein